MSSTEIRDPEVDAIVAAVSRGGQIDPDDDLYADDGRYHPVTTDLGTLREFVTEVLTARALLTDNPEVAIPPSSVRELAKWAYAAAYYDGRVSEQHLLDLPGVGHLVAEIAAANERREAEDFPGEFDDL